MFTGIKYAMHRQRLKNYLLRDIALNTWYQSFKGLLMDRRPKSRLLCNMGPYALHVSRSSFVDGKKWVPCRFTPARHINLINLLVKSLLWMKADENRSSDIPLNQDVFATVFPSLLSNNVVYNQNFEINISWSLGTKVKVKSPTK